MCINTYTEGSKTENQLKFIKTVFIKGKLQHPLILYSHLLCKWTINANLIEYYINIQKLIRNINTIVLIFDV